MSNVPLLVQEQDGILIIRLNRPEKGNSLSLELLRRVNEALHRARVEATIKAVALTGTGDKLFCSGADLTDLTSGGNLEEATQLFADVLLGLVALDKPTAAFLNGHALGGGTGLALACDDVYGVEHSHMAWPEVKGGLFPFMIMPILERAWGAKQSLSLAMEGGTLDALTLAQRGWITGTFAPGDTERMIAQWAAKRTGSAHAALCQGKHLTHQDWLVTLEKRLAEGRKALIAQLQDPTTQAAVKALLVHSASRPV